MAFTIIALGVALSVLVIRLWWRRTRRTESPEAQCRRDVQALRRTTRARTALRAHEADVWSAGEPVQTGSSGKKKIAWVAISSTGIGCGGGTGGCGAGCGGGCGGCGGCGG